MKRITLENIFDALKDMKHEVLIDEEIRLQAIKSIDAMLALPSPKTARPFETGLAPKDIVTLTAN